MSLPVTTRAIYLRNSPAIAGTQDTDEKTYIRVHLTRLYSFQEGLGTAAQSSILTDTQAFFSGLVTSCDYQGLTG